MSIPANSITAEYGGVWRREALMCLACARYVLGPGAAAAGITIDEIPMVNRCRCASPATSRTEPFGIHRPDFTLPSVNLLPGIVSSSDPPIDTDMDVYCQSCSLEAHHDVFHSPPVCPEK